jgi:predicted transcriptional regulator
METLDQLRKRAGLQVKELTELADVSETSYRKMVRGEPIGEVLVNRILRVLSERLRREITLDDIRGINIL